MVGKKLEDTYKVCLIRAIEDGEGYVEFTYNGNSGSNKENDINSKDTNIKKLVY